MNKGFGLIEAMVSLAIMGIVLTAMASVAQQQAISSNAYEAKIAIVDLVQDINGVANDNSLCSQAFTHTSQSITGELTFYFPNAKIIKQGNVLTDYPLKITSITFANSSQVKTWGDGSKTYYGDLMLQVLTTKQPNLARTKKVKSIFITTNASGIITSCTQAIPTPIVPVPTHTCDDDKKHDDKKHEDNGKHLGREKKHVL